MARIFFLAIVVYLGYRLVFDLIVPVFVSARRVKTHFDQMRNPADGSAGTPPPGPQKAPEKRTPVGDYIDFEEVK